MKQLILGIIIGIMLMTSVGFMPGRKEIAHLKISSKTSHESFYQENELKTYKERFTRFDKSGEITEDIQYKKDGTIKSKENFTYNSLGDKTEKWEFKSNDGLTQRTSYSYDALGRKVAENEYDANGLLQKKTSFSYDKKGFLLEKRISNPQGELLSHEKYTYTTY